MASLYNIKEELLRAFDEIEANDGEITEEQYNALCIKQEELKDKLDAYVKAIKEWQKDAEFCKAEKKTINCRQQTYNNRVERLKETVLDAVMKFGECGKTNKFIELPSCRLFTRKSTSTEIINNRVNILIDQLLKLLREVNSTGVMVLGEECDLEGLISSINANCKAEYGDNFQPFNVDDLRCVKINIYREDSLANLLKSDMPFKFYFDDELKNRIEDATTPSYANDVDVDFKSTIWYKHDKYSLQIK